MFYEPGRTKHNLKYDPIKSCEVPRPIGWISTLSPSGVANLAPFSQFQMLTARPPFVMFAANQTHHPRRKDSVTNAESTGEFVCNLATYDLREQVNLSSARSEPDVDEFAASGLTKAPSQLVKPPRVAESKIHIECKYHMTIRLPGVPQSEAIDVVIGAVVGVHIADDVLTESGRVDVLKLKPLSRIGYMDYTTIDRVFEILPPGNAEVQKRLMGGAAKAAE
jgi:flavin reductase (DIM6/NTAB) family NADH-FMN oxidoreductase RutF